MQLADRFGSEVTLLHVAEPVAYGLDFTLGHALTGQGFRKQCEESMAQLAGLFSGRGLSARHEVLSGIPGDVIRLVAHERLERLDAGEEARPPDGTGTGGASAHRGSLMLPGPGLGDSEAKGPAKPLSVKEEDSKSESEDKDQGKGSQAKRRKKPA